LIGIERKSIGDMMQCIRDGRLTGEQLPKLTQTYDWVHLIVEGICRSNRDGILEVWKGRKQGWGPLYVAKKPFVYSELSMFLMTMCYRAGVIVCRTVNMLETAKLVVDMHNWWTLKPWEEHKAHLVLHKPNRMVFHKPSLRRRIAEELPGVGHLRARAAEKAFPTTLEMVIASPDDWLNVEGVGQKTAQKVWAEIRKG
jgi:ERCC4-type nuclease